MANIALIIGTGYLGEDVLHKTPWARHLDSSINVYTISRIDSDIYLNNKLNGLIGNEMCSEIKKSMCELKNISEEFAFIYNSPFFKKQYSVYEIDELQCWLGISFRYIISFDRRFFNKNTLEDSRNEDELNNYVASLVSFYRNFYITNNIHFIVNTLEDDIFSVIAYYTAKKLKICVIGFMNGRFPKRGMMFCQDFKDLCIWNDENVEWDKIESLYDESTIAGKEILIRNSQLFKITSFAQNINRIKKNCRFSDYNKYIIDLFDYEKFIYENTNLIVKIHQNLSIFLRYYTLPLILEKCLPYEKYFFFPLHYEKDAQITFREPLLNQLELIKNISRSLPQGYSLYVKPHPHYLGTDFRFKDLLMISKLKNVKLVNPTIPPLHVLKYSSGVITLNSTTGFEALIKDIPVITFGHEFYCKDYLTYVVRDISELSETLLSVVNIKTKTNKEEIKKFIKTVYSNTIWINPISNPKNYLFLSDTDGKNIALSLNKLLHNYNSK